MVQILSLFTIGNDASPVFLLQQINLEALDCMDSDLQSLITENRHNHLIRSGCAKPVFLQGVFPIPPSGIYERMLVDISLQYTVPAGTQSEILYFRAGNLSDDMIYLTVVANGHSLRYFPLGPHSDSHVELVITESHSAGTCIEVFSSAPRGVSGAVVIDIGIIEVMDRQ